MDALPGFGYFQILLFFFISLAGGHLAKGIAVYFKTRNNHPGKVEPSPTLFLFVIFLFLAIVQYFLAMYEASKLNISTNRMLITCQLISVLSFVMMASIVIPDLNASDVQSRLQLKDEKYSLEEYYKRHRKSLAVFGAIYLASIVFTYPNMHMGWADYETKRLPFHILYLLGLLVMYFSKADNKYFTWIHRILALFFVIMLTMIVYIVR